jgi:hypothetical protein
LHLEQILLLGNLKAIEIKEGSFSLMDKIHVVLAVEFIDAEPAAHQGSSVNDLNVSHFNVHPHAIGSVHAHNYIGKIHNYIG